jgi:outer membrane protein
MDFLKKAKFLKTINRVLKRETLLWTLLVLLVGSNLLLILQSHNQLHKVGYVKLAEVYGKFKMREDLEKQVMQIQKQREEVLYNMKAEIMSQEKEKKESEKGTKLTDVDFRQKVAEFQEEDKKIVSDFDKRLWKQLNQYIQEYSGENHYDLLLGADGSGTMMAADESLNKTSEVIAYVNKRYQGSK